MVLLNVPKFAGAEMNNIFKWLARTLGQAVLWVLFLSISIQGRTIFSYAHEIIVQNPVTQMVDAQVTEAWERLYAAAQQTFSESDGTERTKDRF